MRQPLVAGNWKMNGSRKSVETLLNGIKSGMGEVRVAEVAVAAPFVYIPQAQSLLDGSAVSWGGQDLSTEAAGAFTGEISPGMLKAAGCTYALVGHSERRQYFGESDDGVNRKTRAALESVIIPVVCIGETESEREAGETFSVLDKQIRLGLEGVSLRGPQDLVVAYEPVWAIGTGKTATRDQAQEAHAFIREQLAKALGSDLAAGIRILYGGSVKPDNVKELMAMPDIDGALVGGASLKPEIFAEIIHFGA